MTKTENIAEARLSATQDWKARMAKAKTERPAHVGMQMILQKVVEYNPDIDRLTFATRWHNAWNLRVADIEFTLLVERAVAHYIEKSDTTSKRLSRQKLKKVQ